MGARYNLIYFSIIEKIQNSPKMGPHFLIFSKWGTGQFSPFSPLDGLDPV